MVRESLTEYISRLLKAGYDAGAIRTTLINAGYPPYEVSKAIEYVQTAQAHPRGVSITGKTAVVVIAALILLILIVLGILFIFAPAQKVVELSVMPSKTEFYAGEKVSVISELASEENQAVEVLLTYELVDKRSNVVIAAKQEKIEVGRMKSIASSLDIPGAAAPGSYLISVTLSYDGKELQRSANINVIPKPANAMPIAPVSEESSAECPSTCDDYNRCTTDFCEKGICRHTPISPCCGNGLCEIEENTLNCIEDCRKREDTPDEITAQARQIAKTDAESAAIFCSSITRASLADDCFSQVALSSGKSLICENVHDLENKDRCYVSFALEGDFSVCTRIKNSYLSKACYSLQKTEQLKTSTTV